MGPPTLRIRLFGALDLRYGDTILPAFESARAESLLAYLLLHRSAPQPRQRLAFLLWPDSSEQQARTNLRHLLHRLRRTLPDCERFLDIQPRTLQWRPDAPCWLDVAVFQDTLHQAERNPADLSALAEAIELYSEDLLTTCYDEWILDEREELRQRYLTALERLIVSLAQRKEHSRAILYSERLLRHDPLQEETYRLLMQLYDASGDRARALRTYHACVATLEHELDVEPSPQTRQVYEALLPSRREADAAEARQERGEDAPLIGRTEERLRLAALWRRSESGHAQLVLITGEPGVGKTRLVEEFLSWCAHRGAITAVARSYAAEGALAYGPVVAWLRSEAIMARIKRLARVHRSELARLLPELHGSVPDFTVSLPLGQSEHRHRLFDALARVLLSVGSPLLLMADDLQWYDHETLQFLHYLLRCEPGAQLLVIATARHEDLDQTHPVHDLLIGLQALKRFTEIPIARLSRAETAALARTLARKPLDEAALDQLHQETEGNPLFVVEALRAGWQPGQQRQGQISARVQAVIHARLAQLSPAARGLVGVAATIGRAFSADLLALAGEVDDDTLVRSLDELWRRRILREQDSAAYDFSHDKIREVAYLDLSPALRGHHHLRIAQALDRLYADDPGQVSAQIAAHYDHAGRGSDAILWYQRAAEAAQRVHASSDAARLLDRALTLLQTMPNGPERRTQELALQTALLVPLIAIDGYWSKRMTDVQQRALVLTDSLGIEPEPPLLRSLALGRLSQGDFAQARKLGERLRELGERAGDDVLFVEGEYVLGITAFWQGQFATAREHFEASIQQYRPENRRAHLLHYGQDPKVVCLGRLALSRWFLGDAEGAVQARDAGLALAEEIGHPISLSVALVFSSLLALELGEIDRFRDYDARARTVRDWKATPIQIPSDAFSGLIEVLDGQQEAGIERIQHALADAGSARSAPGMQATMLRLLLAAHVASGRAEAGLAAAEQALRRPAGTRVWEAEAHRLRGEFLAALGGSTEEVEAAFEAALQVAHEQQALALALRAAASLVRYRMQHGNAGGLLQAAERLAATIAAFGKGESNRELGEAIALLEQAHAAVRA